jgi:hypothetical protein
VDEERTARTEEFIDMSLGRVIHELLQHAAAVVVINDDLDVGQEELKKMVLLGGRHHLTELLDNVICDRIGDQFSHPREETVKDGGTLACSGFTDSLLQKTAALAISRH